MFNNSVGKPQTFVQISITFSNVYLANVAIEFSLNDKKIKFWEIFTLVFSNEDIFIQLDK